MAGARNEDTLTGVLEELSDRYGLVPPSVVRLAQYARIRVLADDLGVESVERERHLLVIRFGDRARVSPERLVGFVQARQGISLTPPAVIRIDLEALGRSAAEPPRDQMMVQSSSWWTKRADSGRVTEGFSKDEILETDCSGGAGGLLDQVSSLLGELSGEREATKI